MKTAGRRRKRIRALAFGILRHMPRTRLCVRHLYWAHQSRRYDKLAASASVNQKRVFFESFGGRSFSCSPRALYLTMLQDPRFDDFEFIWCFKGKSHADRFAKMTALTRARVVQRGSDAYFDAVATSGTLILNTRLPEYVTPRQDQTFVQCWHGTPLKRLGYDVAIETTNALNTTSELAERFGMDARKWTYLLSPSPYSSEHLADAFGLPEDRRAQTVLELGYPRNDDLARVMCDEGAWHIQELRYELGIPNNKKVMLYAPTWRDDSYQAGVGYTFDYLLDFDALRAALGDEWVVLFRPHYYIANSFDFSAYRGFVYDASRADDINQLYLVSDLLVTDYSSVMFDYAILRRPMMLFAPDIASYRDDIRGFYFSLDDIPGPCCVTTGELVAAIQGLDGYEERFGAAYDAFRERFCPIDDGHASERVIERLFGRL